MGRHASGPKIVSRGKEPVLYAVFADGSGKKAFVRIKDENGRPISPGAPQHEIATNAWRIFNDRRREVTDITEDNKTIGELTLRYVERRSKGWSDGTMKRYVSYLEQVDLHLDPALRIDEFTVEEAEDLLVNVAGSTGWASGTAERFYWFCRGVFNYARDLGWILGNPFALIPPPQVVPLRTAAPFSEDEVKKLLAVAYTQFRWFYPAIAVAVAAGARRSEICALRVGNYDPIPGILHFPGEITKTREANDVGLPQFVKAALDDCVKGRSPQEQLFVKPSGKPLRSKDFDLTCKEGRDSPRVWRKLLIAAGLELRGVHKLRTAFVTNLVNHGRFTIEEVTAVTGQSVEVAKQHYLKQRINRQAPIVEHLEKVYGQQTGRITKRASQCFIGHAFEEL